MFRALFKRIEDKHKFSDFKHKRQSTRINKRIINKTVRRKLGQEIGIIACGICDDTGCDYFDKEQGCLAAFVPDAVCPYGDK